VGKGNLDGAISEYRQAIALAPRYARAHAALGLVLKEKKDFTGAIGEFRKAIEFDPRDPAIQYLHSPLGYVLREKGDLDGPRGVPQGHHSQPEVG
jgi:Flp pilus assembly protein TadD